MTEPVIRAQYRCSLGLSSPKRCSQGPFGATDCTSSLVPSGNADPPQNWSCLFVPALPEDRPAAPDISEIRARSFHSPEHHVEVLAAFEQLLIRKGFRSAQSPWGDELESVTVKLVDVKLRRAFQSLGSSCRL